MNLKNFKLEQLIQEDSFQRFSTGYYDSYPDEVNLISIKNPASILTTTRHLIADHLYNVLNVFEDIGELHIALRKPDGIPLSEYLSTTHSYDQRIYLGFSLLKALCKYDTFSNAIKYQLLSDDQLLVNNEVICFKELVDYTTIAHHSFKDVILRIGTLLTRIVQPELEVHSRFLDSLIYGSHHYYTLSELLKDYKDIFIYEKYESTSVSSYSAKPKESRISSPSKSESNQPIETTLIEAIEKTGVKLDELDEELRIALAISSSNQKEVEAKPSLPNFASAQNTIEESELLKAELSKLLFEETPQKSNFSRSSIDFSDNTLTAIEDLDSTFAQVKKASSNSFVAKAPIEYEEDDPNDALIEDLFTDDEDLNYSRKNYMVPILSISAIAIIIFIVFKIFFASPSEFKASYKIEVLENERVAFINTTPKLKSSEEIEWTVYYENQLIQTYNSENFYPIFDTAGKYTIALRIMDKDGNWSSEYKKDYIHSAKP